MTDFIKQRRDALLIDASNIMRVTDRRGRLWLSDRFTLVRADLFKAPPKDHVGVFAGDVGVERGTPRARSYLREIRFADTAPLSSHHAMTEAVGDTSVLWFQVGFTGMWVTANERVSRGYAAASLTPRLHREKGVLTWWGRANTSQWALMAVCMPKVATPAPRSSSEVAA